jgi:hypothetical protein
MTPPWVKQLLRAIDRQPTSPKSRDWWDKAPVLSSVLSSVVIGLVGLYVSSTFQRSQLAITKQNNDAQLAITNQKNQSDIRLQELKLASDLMESLVSQDPKRRRVAALMLPSALSNHEMCQQILTALADDSDGSVRIAAITKLGDATTSQAAITLDSFHKDESRPESERTLARDLAFKVSLNSNLPSNSGFLFATVPGGRSYESSKLQGGVFTYALSKGLAGAADLDGDGRITIGELARYVEAQMPRVGIEIKTKTNLSRGIRLDPILSKADDRYRPFLELSGSPDLVVAEPKAALDSHHKALIVGVSQYPQEMPSLMYASSDADRIADTLKRLGVQTTTLHDPTHDKLASELHAMASSINGDDTFYFFFAGHGWSLAGENMLGPTNMKITPEGITGGFSIEQLKSELRRVQPKAAFAFFDVCRNEISSTK